MRHFFGFTKIKLYLLAGMAGAGMFLSGCKEHTDYQEGSYKPPALAYQGETTGLERTIIVPTLDSPAEKGKNVIWCGSFQMAWDQMVKDVIGEPIQLSMAGVTGMIETPQERSNSGQVRSQLTDKIVTHWAGRRLADWREKGKVVAPRILAAKLAARIDVEEVNSYLREQKPWSGVGSSWSLHPDGDYDFTLTILSGILWMFGEDEQVLYPDTRKHLLDTLLTEEGKGSSLATPMTLGLMQETENHILMIRGSGYLKNRWLDLHGNSAPLYDNRTNGMEEFLLAYLGNMRKNGLYEFNSIPYLAYTITALLNLEAFGSEPVRECARGILDQIHWHYAVGSLGLRRCAPFRRQLRRTGVTSLQADSMHHFARVWLSRLPGTAIAPDEELIGSHNALWASLMPYQLPDQTAEWLQKKPAEYLVCIGHGVMASPEIYSGGPGYLLSAGGVHRGPLSLMVSRPITLLLDDGQKDMEGVLHLAGPGKKMEQWNNTGVYKNFACAAGEVHIPAGWAARAKNEVWSVYKRGPIRIAVHSRKEAGIAALFHKGSEEEVLKQVTGANPDIQRLGTVFRWPKGDRIGYDLHAPKNLWVIQATGREKVDREFDKWPLLAGWMKEKPQ